MDGHGGAHDGVMVWESWVWYEREGRRRRRRRSGQEEATTSVREDC